MIYQIAIAITIFAISFSLNSMERPKEQSKEQPKKQSSTKRAFKKAKSYNPFSSNKSKNKEAVKTTDSNIKHSTFYKKLPYLSLICDKHLPQDIKKVIQYVSFDVESEKLDKNEKLSKKWKEHELDLLDFHSLNQPDQVSLMEDLFTSGQLSQESYKKFVKDIPLKMRYKIAQKSPFVSVPTLSAREADTMFQHFGIEAQPGQRFGTVNEPVVTKKDKELMLLFSSEQKKQLPKQRRQLKRQ